MLDDFLVRAALAGVGSAIAAGLLGCFVVWRRMSYFGDATAHAAILGVAVSLAFNIGIFWGVGGVALLMALIIYGLSGRRLSADTILGVLSHSALAIGLVAVSLLPNVRVDLDTFLFGDVLTVSRTDIAVIWAGAVLVVVVLWWNWQSLLTSTLSPDLARAAGIHPKRQELILTLLLAAVVALSIKVIGALLITALLIIPAAAARGISRSPEHMAVISVIVGVLSALGGIRFSFLFDTPVGPSIVCTAAALFVVSRLVALRGA